MDASTWIHMEVLFCEVDEAFPFNPTIGRIIERSLSDFFLLNKVKKIKK
jgi:hypothetical protein